MKRIVLALISLTLVSFASDGEYKMIKVVEDATNSNNSVEVNILEEDRPDGFIIKRSKQEPIPVKMQTTSMDDDKDGILNDKDECPDTPEGKVVDQKGCLKLIRLNVRFAYDKYDITKDYANEIEKAAEFLNENTQLSVSVDGHTDSDGSIAYNQKLSEKRAASVSNKLIELGVKKEKITATGYGELKPAVPNDSDANKAINRRVDISFNR